MPEVAMPEVGALVVRRRVEEAEGVVSLTLGRPDGAPLPAWTPGAHVEVHLGNGLIRQYSLCGPLDDPAHWRIAVLREPDGRGGSAWIHDNVREGDTLRIGRLRNNFALDDAPRYLFVAGGIGVTPLLPMVAAAAGAGRDWRLVYGGRRRASMAFLEELTAHGDRVQIVPQDEHGLLDLETLLGEPAPGTLVYCCGPAPLLEAVEKHCAAWPPGSLRVERFTADPDAAAASADGDTAVELVCARSGVTVTAPPGVALLTALEEAGVPILSSCTEGICGTCETVVLEGEPDHRDSLLTDDERAAGDTMLVCVSRARTARLVLDL